jgi:hypothetical protein
MHGATIHRNSNNIARFAYVRCIHAAAECRAQNRWENKPALLGEKSDCGGEEVGRKGVQIVVEELGHVGWIKQLKRVLSKLILPCTGPT